jgi:hypothetical protein
MPDGMLKLNMVFRGRADGRAFLRHGVVGRVDTVEGDVLLGAENLVPVDCLFSSFSRSW